MNKRKTNKLIVTGMHGGGANEEILELLGGCDSNLDRSHCNGMPELYGLRTGLTRRYTCCVK